MPAERQRTLHYKRAQLLSGADVDLQDLLNKAIAASLDVEGREQTLTEGGSTRRVLSGVGATNGMFTARFMQFTNGQKQHYFEKDAKTGDYRLDVTAVPGASEKLRREFVESLTFLAVSKAHVMFVAALHLGSRALEDHINWLLRHHGIIATDEFVLLADLQSQEAEEKLAKHPVDKIVIGGDLDFEVVESVPTQRKTKSRDTVPGYKKVRPIGAIADSLGPLFGDWLGDVPLSQALGRNERIAVKLELSYSNRKKTEEGFEMMQKLAVAGRHFDIGQTKIWLHGGGYLLDKDLKVQAPIQVRVFESGLIDEHDLWVRINSWLRHAVARGVVHQ